MRKWLIEETGEVRSPKAREWFWNDIHDRIDFSMIDMHTHWKILRVTEITEKEKE